MTQNLYYSLDHHPVFTLELPLGNSTYAAGADEGTEFIGHRSALALPVLPGQIQLGDSAHDQTDNYHWVHDQGGIAVFAYNRRNEHLDSESLLHRGYDQHGTPMRRAAACVAPMATTTRPRVGSMSVASRAHPRSNSTARIDTGCWATATA